ncbi:MAG: Radical SAM domain protein [Candidatus Peregrinibacteria bacterium GW2011_GWF2_33_10]|nr:MAG: Radical SAM domain protein [Candidatus Peregrinibacteria bacterium GW2011_GWF2_33_10]OGJ44735.1 MAG: hypothetical protein A2263_02095 [Candidatus Peregrinibacteria bacterium RIFOXYA2_FULL_33_21]OGJ47334.1 MAG: hypothetical protein A2272_00565 [Candidatus Peregrinibacteria bacterium RIFOXYA12_FULL_33_12]OGJ50601.1 MAG: hypothetical protein A2307_00080 [Candidatus Peregrinibacteria bacterium RIFOXYB2_FULL_33_20]
MENERYDFGNILFSGPCNAKCPECIGKLLEETKKQLNNLQIYPLLNIEPFVALLKKQGVREVIFTGTNTDPQLYGYEEQLIADLRRELGDNVLLSLHTNGRLAVKRRSTFNQYDKATISIPSFTPEVYKAMMGVSPNFDLSQILNLAKMPIKISRLTSLTNREDCAAFLRHCLTLGIKRVAFRKLFGEVLEWEDLVDINGLGMQKIRNFHGNSVYNYKDMEVTLWDFSATGCRSISLFSDGHISDHYLLIDAMKQ